MLSKKNIAVLMLTLAIGFLLGWLLFGKQKERTKVSEEETEQSSKKADQSIWTCSMHPQVRKQEPGDCPICGMELIPLKEEQSGIDADAVAMSPTAIQLANIKTATVGEEKPVKKLFLNGKVQEDERKVVIQSTHIPGRVERLLIDFTGAYIQKGNVIAYIYSPELVTAQKELLEASEMSTTEPQLLESAKQKLKNWRLSNRQIEQILNSGKVQESFPVTADVSGYVIEKQVKRGDYIQKGAALFKIADLSTVWIFFDIYETDLKWIEEGDKVTFTIPALPGQSFESRIDYIDPVISAKSRVAKARAVYKNENKQLKPEMLVRGSIKAQLQVYEDGVIVPKSAVLWTGTRSVVYVMDKNAQSLQFKMREVTLGPALGEQYIIESGLQKGEEIAVSGAFSIDAAAQLAGKSSMMQNATATPSAHKKHGKHLSFQVAGNCSMCKSRIEEAVNQLNGVFSADWNIDSKTLHLNYNPDKVSELEIHKSIAEAGHSTEKIKAEEQVYEDLPACCQYPLSQ